MSGLRLVEHHGDDGIQRAADDVLAKLRAVLPRDLCALLDESGLFAGPPARRPVESVDAATIRKTIRASRKARIAYQTGEGRASKRTIWPIALSFMERLRMVIAWCELRNDFRCFRVDRIQEWTELSEPISRSRMALLGEWRKRENISE